MKTTNQILIFLAAMSLMSCGQLHVVTLYVDTTNIKQGSIATNANFGQPLGISNEDFTTHVRKGDRIIWEAVSISDPQVEVKIDSVYHISGEKIFERKLSIVYPKSLTTKSGFVKELFAGTIQKKPKRSIQRAFILEKYGLDFTVAGKEGPFTIDPVIKAYR